MPTAEALPSLPFALMSPPLAMQGPTTSAPVNMSLLPTSLAQLQRDFATASKRPVDTEQAASVINEVRRHALAAHGTPGFKAAQSNIALVQGITDDHVERWMYALGVKPADFESMKRAAFVSGLPNPFGGDLSNLLSYVVAPVAGALTGSPFVALGIGAATAAAAPFVNAYFQTGVVTRCDVYRERNGPSVNVDKADLNDKHSLHEAANQVATCTLAFAEACTAFQAASSAQGGVPAARREERVALAQDVLSTCEAMCKAQHQALMTQGSHERQQVGNSQQVVPRTLRPLGAGLPALGANAGGAGERVARYSSNAAVGIQSGAAALVMFAHHFAAGADERNKALYKNKLNMLYADVFTEGGKSKVSRGELLTGDDIDPAKFRRLVESPAQAFVGRVVDAIKTRKAAIDDDIKERVSPLFVDLELGLPRSPAEPAPEPNESLSQLEDLRSTSTQLKHDLVHLKAGNLEALPRDSAARELITQGLKSFSSPLLDAAVEKKFNTKGEYSAQALQRLGQALHLGVFGSAAASTVGRVASALSGGASNTPTAQLLGVTAGAGVMAYVGASKQYIAVSEKNHRRDNVDTVSMGQQFMNGATGLIRETSGMHAMSKAIGKANSEIDSARQRQIIQAAQELVADAHAAVDQLHHEEQI